MGLSTEVSIDQDRGFLLVGSQRFKPCAFANFVLHQLIFCLSQTVKVALWRGVQKRGETITQATFLDPIGGKYEEHAGRESERPRSDG